MNDGHIYVIQVLFVTGIAIGSQVLSFQDKLKWLNVARFTIYILTVHAVPEACKIIHRLLARQPPGLPGTARASALTYSACVAALLLAEQPIFTQDFVFLFLGYLVVKYPEMSESVEQTSSQAESSCNTSGGAAAKPKTAINYGVGMACSYFEGYLTHILPSDGHKFVGYEENIRTLEGSGKADRRASKALTPLVRQPDNDELRPAVTAVLPVKAAVTARTVSDTPTCGEIIACYYFEDHIVHLLASDGYEFLGFGESIRALEDNEGVLFPVKKMFIVITKSFYSPPDLKEFNRGTDVPYLEAFNILPEIRKSVAGVKDRIYHNTAYKIYRPPAAPPVCLTVECASPLHTLYKVINNRRLYDELAEINIEDVKNDFCNTLQSILNKSHECRGKCELVYYDHEDPTQNLSEILLKRIRELCPNFEEKIIARRAENKIIEN